MKDLSPVALFVYNRLENTKQTVECLKRNELASETVLYVFSDGPKNEETRESVQEVRDFLRSIDGFKQVVVTERPVNFYLERNIIQGLEEVLSKHQTVIVLEDDICTSPTFLRYMNDALEKYRDEKKVMHVSAFTNLSIPSQGDTHLTAHMCGWGWATWKDRWKHFVHFASREQALEGFGKEMRRKIEYNGAFPCLKSLDKHPIPWDICWEMAIHKQQGLCLNPNHTLIRNIGLKNGTHYSTQRIFGWYEFDREPQTRVVVIENIPVKENPTIEAMYAKALKDHGMRYNLLGKIVRFLYKRLTNRPAL